MKKLLLLNILMPTILLSAKIVIEKPCNNLILIMDPHHDENEKKSTIGPMIKIFSLAFYEQVAPIITTQNIARNFIQKNLDYQNIFKDLTKYALQLNSVNSAINENMGYWKSLLQSKNIVFNNENDINDILYASILTGTKINDSHWTCFIHKTADLVLFIPKKVSMETDPNKWGFDSTHLTKINDLSSLSLSQALKNSKQSPPEEFITELIALFATKQRNNKPWNIYLTGHGSLPEKKIPSLKEQFTHYFFKSNSIEPVIINATSQVAGLFFTQFQQLLTFFHASLNMSFLHYMSCYSGGYNQSLVNDVLTKLNVNFIVSAEGANEATIMPPQITLRAPTASNNEIKLTPKRFEPFFSQLESFFEGKNSIEIETKFKDPLKSIIYSVIYNPSQSQTQPFIRIPAAGMFSALSVDKKVKILTNSVVKAYEFEGKNIDCSTDSISTLIIYPSYIAVPLYMHHDQKIIFHLTQTNVPNEQAESAYIFENIINKKASFYSFIGNLIALNNNIGTTTIIIKNLTCANSEGLDLQNNGLSSLAITNMIIHIKGTLTSLQQTINSNIDILFTHNNQNYYISKSANDIIHNKYDLINFIAQSSAKVITNQQLYTYAQLWFKDNNDIQLTDISLPLVIQKYQNKYQINTVQKIGALKEVLLKKIKEDQFHNIKKHRYEASFLEPTVNISTPKTIQPTFIQKNISQQENISLPVKQSIFTQIYNWWRQR